ncbi:MAG: hypothetical protein EKK54_03920 [Neisseriaceae bacterium]|nr:MAG: hypothetical protein EKK54_03920 [Neisseriaceae bacterium]
MKQDPRRARQKRNYDEPLPRDEMDDSYQDQNSYSQPRRRPWMKILIFLIVLIAIVLAVKSYLNHKSVEVSENVTIVAVTPIESTILIPHEECHNETTSKLVKNKNATFFNNLFDSKKNPKYIQQNSTKRVCQTVNAESQVTNGYVVKYQFGNYIESMNVVTPPPLNAVIPLTELQKYQQQTLVNNVASDAVSNK